VDRELKREFYAWSTLLGGLLSQLVDRALRSEQPSELFFEEFAGSLEHLAKRVRRHMKGKED
jgi:recombinational DNA repair protein (RecF pathway)